MDRVIVGNLNVASLSNKMEELSCVVKGRVDILVLTETKLDDSFLTSQFTIDGYCTPYSQDRNMHGGGILIYVREDIPTKVLNHMFPDVILNKKNISGPPIFCKKYQIM